MSQTVACVPLLVDVLPPDDSYQQAAEDGVQMPALSLSCTHQEDGLQPGWNWLREGEVHQ